MLTLDEINNLRSEELEATNKKIAKRLLIRIAVPVAISTAVTVVVAALDRKFNSSEEQDA